MEIRRIIAGIFHTNTYLLTIGEFAIYIDPASKPIKMIEELGDKKLIGILLTHGHFDHIKAVDDLANKYKAPVYVHKDDEYLIRNRFQAKPFGILNSPYITSPVTYLQEGKMNIGPFEFETIFTPGHTKGSVCYKFDNDLFTGDTLFKESVGRTDLDGGDSTSLKSSLRILGAYSENLIIHPGHEDESCLDYEKKHNTYLR